MSSAWQHWSVFARPAVTRLICALGKPFFCENPHRQAKPHTAEMQLSGNLNCTSVQLEVHTVTVCLSSSWQQGKAYPLMDPQKGAQPSLTALCSTIFPAAAARCGADLPKGMGSKNLVSVTHHAHKKKKKKMRKKKESGTECKPTRTTRLHVKHNAVLFPFQQP